MREYTQISVNERMKLSVMKQAGQSLRQIAYALGRSPSTVSRELRRNFSAAGQHYWPDTATQLARQRRRRGCKLDRVQELASFVKERLHCEAWSPEQIAGYLNGARLICPMYVMKQSINGSMRSRKRQINSTHILQDIRRKEACVKAMVGQAVGSKTEYRSMNVLRKLIRIKPLDIGRQTLLAVLKTLNLCWF